MRSLDPACLRVCCSNLTAVVLIGASGRRFRRARCEWQLNMATKRKSPQKQREVKGNKRRRSQYKEKRAMCLLEMQAWQRGCTCLHPSLETETKCLRWRGRVEKLALIQTLLNSTSRQEVNWKCRLTTQTAAVQDPPCAVARRNLFELSER